jgi:SSS family solute:Na+ symporter
MLFTGLLGAWLSAVFLIPKVSELGHKYKFFTFPQIFGHFYNGKVALLAGIISAIGISDSPVRRFWLEPN